MNQIHNEESAKEYIKEKRILQFVQALTTAIAYSQPEDPVSFLEQLLSDIKKARDSNEAIFICFSPENVKTMFTVLDPFNKGTITRAQFEGALRNFGVDLDLIPNIIGDGNGPYKIEEFSKAIQDGIRQTLFPQK